MAAGEHPEYTYYSPEEVAAAFEELKYAPSRRYIEAFYLKNDYSRGVAVTTVTKELAEGHLDPPIMPGATTVEMMAQSLLFLLRLTGRIPEGQVAVLATLNAVEFKTPVVPGAILNTYVENADPIQNIGKGLVKCGKFPIASGNFTAGFFPRDRFVATVLRVGELQQKSIPEFPLRP